jgi:hypothetical protein
MNREDREALFMILERNSVKSVLLMVANIAKRGWCAVTDPEGDTTDGDDQ